MKLSSVKQIIINDRITICEDYNCKNVYFKCPGFYCVPWQYVCDGKWDCPGGLEEKNCNRTSCPAFFKCQRSSICVTLQSICDVIENCPLGDDEFFCSYVGLDCPMQCNCLLFAISCHSITKQSFLLEKHYLHFAHIQFFHSNPQYVKIQASIGRS